MISEIYTKFKLNTQIFNPILIKHFGAPAGLLLGVLINYCYTLKTYDNYFEYSVDVVEQQVGLSKEQQLVALNSLAEQNVLVTKYEGIPVRCYIRLNSDVLSTIFNISEDDKLKITNISQFKKLASKTKTPVKGKNKFQQFYSLATEKFADKDLLDLLYKYLQEKIGAISRNQWEICLKHLEDYGLQYPPQSRKLGMCLMVEKAIGGGWFDFYKISDYELSQHCPQFNQFGEPIQNSSSVTGDIDSQGKNCNFDLALDDNGNPLKF